MTTRLYATPPASGIGAPAISAIGATRTTVGLLAIAVVGYAYVDAIGHGEGHPLDYFGYFTNQTSLIAGVVLVVTGVRTLLANRRGAPLGGPPGAALESPSPAPLTTARAVATTCLVVVAVVYNGLVPGTGSAPAWVSVALHAVLPAYAVLDWIFVGDRGRLGWRSLWIVLPYPLIWLAVVLVRGATDGWVPYGFLLPERGTASLVLHIVGLFLALLGAAALIWGATRFDGVPMLCRSDTDHSENDGSPPPRREPGEGDPVDSR